MTAHSLLPPSSAERRMACPKSRGLEAKYPSPPHPSAEEGTIAHDIAAMALRCQDQEWLTQKGACSPRYTEEMLAGAELYRNLVHGISPINLHIEERVEIAVINPACWGTPDCWYFNGGDLHVFDYKYGRGYVNVFENWQLIEYSAGILNKLRMEGHDVGNTRVHYYIIQPRCFVSSHPVRSWSATVYELQPYFERLKEAEDKAIREIGDYSPSSACKNCSARAACPALKSLASSLVDYSRLPTSDGIIESSIGTELKLLQEARDLLESRITGLEAEATVRLRSGRPVQHFALTNGRSKQAWSISTDDVEALGKLYGANIIKRDVITPKQAIAVGIPEQVVESVSTVIPGALRLTAINNDEIRQIFAK